MVCNIWSHALEFGRVRHPLCKWAGENWFATSDIMHWSLVGQYSPLANWQGKSGLEHLESCTKVWVGKTPPLLMGKGKWFGTSGALHWSLGG